MRFATKPLQLRLEQSKTRARVLSAVAHSLLQMREQASTPLQNLRLVQKLLGEQRDNPEQIHTAMDRSLVRLEDLHKDLKRYDSLIDWSIDPLDLKAEPEAAAIRGDDTGKLANCARLAVRRIT